MNEQQKIENFKYIKAFFGEELVKLNREDIWRLGMILVPNEYKHLIDSCKLEHGPITEFKNLHTLMMNMFDIWTRRIGYSADFTHIEEALIEMQHKEMQDNLVSFTAKIRQDTG